MPVQPDDDGYLNLPESPGLGVEIDWAALEPLRVYTGAMETQF
jgi:L-alanine-DL-glutamate epimerase-like enolase superfamily enzyme